jgi:hypothetical protein
MKKICKNCKEEKDIDNFLKIHNGKHYQSSCKKCTYELSRKWKAENKERCNFLKRKWQQNNKGRYKEQAKLYFKKYRKKVQENLNLKTQRNARIYLNMKIKRNEITKRNICEICLNSPTDCHHENYNKPYEFIELCRLCHKLLHQQYKERNIIL